MVSTKALGPSAGVVQLDEQQDIRLTKRNQSASSFRGCSGCVYANDALQQTSSVRMQMMIMISISSS